MRLASSRMGILSVLFVSLVLLANAGNLQAQGVTDPQIPPVLKAAICKQSPVNPMCDQKVTVTIIEQGKEQRINETRFVVFQRLQKLIDQSTMGRKDKEIAEQKLVEIVSLLEPLDSDAAAATKPTHTIKANCEVGAAGGQAGGKCGLAYEISF